MSMVYCYSTKCIFLYLLYYKTYRHLLRTEITPCFYCLRAIQIDTKRILGHEKQEINSMFLLCNNPFILDSE